MLSASNQDYDNKTIFVIDNNSIDSSWLNIQKASEVIEPKTTYNKVDKKYFHSSLKNFIIKSVSADIYCIVPGNIILKKTKISTAVNNILEKYADFIYNDYLTQDDIYISRFSYDKERLLKYPSWPDSYCITKRVLDKIGNYNDKISSGDDYDILLKCTDIGLAIHVPTALEKKFDKKEDDNLTQNINTILHNAKIRMNG